MISFGDDNLWGILVHDAMLIIMIGVNISLFWHLESYEKSSLWAPEISFVIYVL